MFRPECLIDRPSTAIIEDVNPHSYQEIIRQWAETVAEISLVLPQGIPEIVVRADRLIQQPISSSLVVADHAIDNRADPRDVGKREFVLGVGHF